MNKPAEIDIDMSETAQTPWRHWSLSHDQDRIAWLTIDREGESTNSLSLEVLQELEEIVTELERATPAGVVLMSGKRSGFIAGADVREFDSLTDRAAVEARIRGVHELFDRIEALPCPTVAAISGFCLGGGLELALTCDYRIAQDLDSTRIGFPEIKLGIFPGFGGTARSTALIGGRQALELMLTGRGLRARAARAMGLIDEVITSHDELRWVARRAVLQKRRTKGAGRLERMTNSAPMRALLATVMKKQVARKARPEHYPAPYALIDLWSKHGGSRREMLDGEARIDAELNMGDTARGLRRVFHLMERLKGLGKTLGKDSDFRPRRVHVIGAGVMGGDIAAWCVVRGMEVTLQDRAMEYIEPALARGAKLFRQRLRKPHLSKAAESRLIADPEGKGVARADVVIEAIFENLEAKQALFRDLEPRMKAGAVLATNTSAIPLAKLATVLARPERLIGLHFFNPVAQMPLVEVVKDKTTDPLEVSKGCAFSTTIGKLPLPVNSGPGFLVNRVLAPYLMEAMEAHEEGVAKEAIDRAAVAFGMPMGPVELADTVGLDVCLMVSGVLGENANPAARDKLRNMVEAGKLGRKSGQGLYRWEKGRPVRSKDSGKGQDLEALARRLLQPLFDECKACLEEGVVEDADLVDAGVIFGTGFAPFRGGPLNYLATTTNA